MARYSVPGQPIPAPADTGLPRRQHVTRGGHDAEVLFGDLGPNGPDPLVEVVPTGVRR